MGSEAQTVFRILFVSPSPGDFPARVDFILRLLPHVKTMAAAAAVCILIARDLQAREAISLPVPTLQTHGRPLLGHVFKVAP